MVTRVTVRGQRVQHSPISDNNCGPFDTSLGPSYSERLSNKRILYAGYCASAGCKASICYKGPPNLCLSSILNSVIELVTVERNCRYYYSRSSSIITESFFLTQLSFCLPTYTTKYNSGHSMSGHKPKIN